MKQSCWSCKHCINDYFATGTMDCKRQDDMTEDEFENYYGDNGGENCPYYEEDTREQNVYFIGGIEMNEDIKKSLDKIRESVEKMRHVALNYKLAEEYKNILEEVDKIEKISK